MAVQLTNLQAFHISSGFDDLACALMPQSEILLDDRRANGAFFPEVHIGAADPCSAHMDEAVIGSRLWCVDLNGVELVLGVRFDGDVLGFQCEDLGCGRHGGSIVAGSDCLS